MPSDATRLAISEVGRKLPSGPDALSALGARLPLDNLFPSLVDMYYINAKSLLNLSSDSRIHKHSNYSYRLYCSMLTSSDAGAAPAQPFREFQTKGTVETCMYTLDLKSAERL